MAQSRIQATAVFLFSGIFLSVGLSHADEKPNPWKSDESPGFAALATASAQGRYAFVHFWKNDDEPSQRMEAVLASAVARMPAKPAVVNICVSDPMEKPTVEKFGVARAPLPMVVAVAPNGAVTKAWPLAVKAEQLKDGIVTQSAAQCLKAVQDDKLVLISVQSGKSAANLAAWQGVLGVTQDARFAASSQVVKVDPTDAREASFLKSLDIDPATNKAVTVLLAPPGRPVARFVGAVSTQQIVAKITSAQSGCCPGGKCGPKGCCPEGKCGPATQ